MPLSTVLLAKFSSLNLAIILECHLESCGQDQWRSNSSSGGCRKGAKSSKNATNGGRKQYGHPQSIRIQPVWHIRFCRSTGTNIYCTYDLVMLFGKLVFQGQANGQEIVILLLFRKKMNNLFRCMKCVIFLEVYSTALLIFSVKM